MNESSPPVEVASSAQLGPVAEVRDGLLRLHIPSDDYSLPTRLLHGTHLLYEITSKAALDVLSERTRQIEAEGWTPEHDDEHDNGELASAGCAYALAAADALHPLSQGDGNYTNEPPPMWLWDREWWKPGEPRRMLVNAAALLLAEIERLDRTEA